MTRDEALKRAAEICTASHDLLHDHSVSSIKHAARIADALQQAAKDATLAEVENLKAQLAESRAEVEQHSHAADIWMIAESKAARERDDLKAENERLAKEAMLAVDQARRETFEATRAACAQQARYDYDSAARIRALTIADIAKEKP